MPQRRPTSRAVLALSLLALAALVFAAAAGASSVKLKCGGPGARNVDSAGTVLCAAAPGKARTIVGKVRDDENAPVATKVTVTYIAWNPVGEGSFQLDDVATKTINSKADGSFSLPVETDTRLGVRFSVGDEAKGVGAFEAEAEVSRRLEYRFDKLGGGKVKMTVIGAGRYPTKLYILEESGYEIPGVKPKKANRAGSAVFDLGNRHGKFSFYAEVSKVEGLFWDGGRGYVNL